MATYKARTSAPAKTNKFFVNYQKGGYCTAITIDSSTGYVLPNCVGYAQGRLLEMQNIKKVDWTLPACNAEDWYETAKKQGLKVGSTPKIGAVICWASGKTQTSSDGAGHVAVVDAIDKDGTITISESAYKSYLFKTEKVKAPYARTGMKLMGFIYPNTDFGIGDLGKEEKQEEKTETASAGKKELTASSYPDLIGGGVYRVRKAFSDAASSVGSFSIWANAYKKWKAYQSKGYHVYDTKGNQLD